LRFPFFFAPNHPPSLLLLLLYHPGRFRRSWGILVNMKGIPAVCSNMVEIIASWIQSWWRVLYRQRVGNQPTKRNKSHGIFHADLSLGNVRGLQNKKVKT